MVTKIVQEWEVTISITRTLTYPLEDVGEDKDDFKKWARTPKGKQYIQGDFIKKLNCYSFPKNADMTIDDVELKETEVSSWDTDSRC